MRRINGESSREGTGSSPPRFASEAISSTLRRTVSAASGRTGGQERYWRIPTCTSLRSSCGESKAESACKALSRPMRSLLM